MTPTQSTMDDKDAEIAALRAQVEQLKAGAPTDLTRCRVAPLRGTVGVDGGADGTRTVAVGDRHGHHHGDGGSGGGGVRGA